MRLKTEVPCISAIHWACERTRELLRKRVGRCPGFSVSASLSLGRPISPKVGRNGRKSTKTKTKQTCAKGSVLSVPFRAMRQYFSEGGGMFRNFPCYGTIRGENVRHVPFISVPWDSTFLTVSNLPLGRQSFCLTMPYGNLTWTMHLRYNKGDCYTEVTVIQR